MMPCAACFLIVEVLILPNGVQTRNRENAASRVEPEQEIEEIRIVDHV